MSDSDLRAWIEVKQEINETLYWLGSVANPGFWADYSTLAIDFDPPWWHCKPCIDSGAGRFRARLSTGTRFCPQCGTAIQWPEREGDE